MPLQKINILITGAPGTGKTTLIRNVAEELRTYRPAGFYTEEIRERGSRRGFDLVSLDNRRRLLSHVDIRGPCRVGKYGVDREGFDRFLDTIPFSDLKSGLFIIDEIGKMECFSEKFRKIVTGLLDAERPVIATIALKGGGFLSHVKKRSDVLVVELTRNNRDLLIKDIVKSMKEKSPRLQEP